MVITITHLESSGVHNKYDIKNMQNKHNIDELLRVYEAKTMKLWNTFFCITVDKCLRYFASLTVIKKSQNTTYDVTFCNILEDIFPGVNAVKIYFGFLIYECLLYCLRLLRLFSQIELLQRTLTTHEYFFR